LNGYGQGIYFEELQRTFINLVVRDNRQDFIFPYRNNPAAWESVENAIPKFLWKGKGVEIKSANNFLSGKSGITQLVLPFAGIRRNDLSTAHNETNATIEALQLDFVLLCHIDRPAAELQLMLKEAYRILKTSGVLILLMFDPDSEAAESLSRNGNRFDSSPTVEQIMFELSHCGFSHFEFMQTLFGPSQNMDGAQEPKCGYGEGLLVVVQARKTI
jgi:SAM-dependent methyltransferase